MRSKLLALTIKYQADYNKISQALSTGESIAETDYPGKYITYLDPEYPQKLLALKKPPYVLFYKGDISLLKTASVSIVGSRRATAYASAWTKKFTSLLVSDYTIVSGLALGIDAIAHKSALAAGGKTIAVLGCGIDYIYPYQNRELFLEIEKSGLIISEFYGNLKPKPYYFPYRNRLVAALGQALYVMQAGLRSGTLTSASEALELNRDIYVLPYPLDCPEGIGCNILIQEGANILFDKIWTIKVY